MSFWGIVKKSYIGWLSFHHDQRGVVALLFGVIIAVFLGFAVISLDAGTLYAARQRLVDAADAAALAGAQLLPDNAAGAAMVAEDYARRNGRPDDQISVEVSPGQDMITVAITRKVKLHFAILFGARASEIQARAIAIVGDLTTMRGVAPIGVERGNFVFGEVYALKLGPRDNLPKGYHGNFHALALGGKGASIYRENLKSGFQEVLHVGDVVETEPGNMAGPTLEGIRARLEEAGDETWDNYSYQSRRRIYVPVIDSFEVNGRSQVKIVGFAAFFLEEIPEEDGNGQDVVVKGRFIREYQDGEATSLTMGRNFGLRAVRLVQPY